MTTGNTTKPLYTPPIGPYAEISLDNLVWNLSQVRSRIPAGSKVIAVVKDNAYGCGSVPVAHALEREGVDFFAVARAEEAQTLVAAGVSSPILVLGEASDDDISSCAGGQVHFALNDISSVTRWARIGCPVSFQIKINTGMGRLGVQTGEISSLITAIAGNPSLICTGIYTHFASADVPDSESVRLQHDRFRKSLTLLRNAGINPTMVHCANSAAIIRHPMAGFTHVRPGIVLYGCNPDPAQEFGLALKPVLSLKSLVVKVWDAPAGTTISYGETFITSRATRIAAVAAGYACGIPRALAGKGGVIIRGKRFPIAGRITMDYVMADVGPDSTVKTGDEVVIIGEQNGIVITADEIALQCSTIGYEILCGIATNMHRFYIIGNGLFTQVPPYIH